MSLIPNQPDTNNGRQQITPTQPHLRQLALQFAATFVVLSLAWPYFGVHNAALPWPETALAIGGVALLLASLTRQPWWWRLIHALFAPLAWCISELSINPNWFLLTFVLMLLVYRGALSGQIPLYLSNKDTATVLAKFVSEHPGAHFIDLGAGIASIVRPLARACPEARLTGIENAPATWVVGYLRTMGLKNCRWLWGNIWNINLAEYDVVYSFLSPAPMTALWEKIQSEMRPGTLFISNSFPVPGIEASDIVEIDDTRRTRLYCYKC